MYYLKWRRYLIRQYIYPVFCILFIILLIQWNSMFLKESDETQLENSELLKIDYTPIEPKIQNKLPQLQLPDKDKKDNEVSSEHVLPIPEEKVPKKLIDNEIDIIPPKAKGNTLSITIYMESQCPDTTGFIKGQLIPAFNSLNSIDRINYTIIPFGKAKCEFKNDDYECECQHGEPECLLNQLMNCVIDHFPLADVQIPIIGCLQGQSNLESAFRKCIADNQDPEWLLTCTNSKRGRYLHAIAGQRTAKLGSAFNFVPWIVIDENRVNDAFYALEENICKRLDVDKPIQCKHFV